MNHYFYKIEKGLEDFLSCKQTLYANPLITINDKGYTKHYFEEGKRICSKIGSGELRDINDLVNHMGMNYEDQLTTQYEGIKDGNRGCIGGGWFDLENNNLYKSIIQPYGNPINPDEPIFYYHSDHLGSASFLTDRDGYETQQLVYLPFGEDWVDMKYNTGQYDTPYKFNGKEKDEELRSNREYNNINNKFHEQTGYNNYGARYYYDWASIWLSVDPMSDKYPHLTSYNYCANNPVMLVDPDGRYILFIGGLRLMKGNADQQRAWGGFKIHNTDVYKYWSIKENTFGREAKIADYYTNKYKDNNVGFTSGSSQWNSSAKQRMGEGRLKAELFHKMVQNGDIKLEAGETIKVISHSQGGAHAAGFAEKLMSYKDAGGNSLYNVEVVEYITPHQPKDITHPEGPLGIQYSHPSDAVSSDSPWWLPNGGTEYGKINGINKFFGEDIMGGNGQPPCGGPAGNRCGHNVTDNDEFIKKGE